MLKKNQKVVFFCPDLSLEHVHGGAEELIQVQPYTAEDAVLCHTT